MSEPDSTASDHAGGDDPMGPSSTQIAPAGPADSPGVVRAETPSKGKPVIELLPGGKPVIAIRPETGTGEKRVVLQRKSSPVIARSSRVRELPPPPKIAEELHPGDSPTDSDRPSFRSARHPDRVWPRSRTSHPRRPSSLPIFRSSHPGGCYAGVIG